MWDLIHNSRLTLGHVKKKLIQAKSIWPPGKVSFAQNVILTKQNKNYKAGRTFRIQS